MNSLIQKLKNEGNLRLYHDYRTGHTQDLSGTGNHGVSVAGTVIFNGNAGASFRETYGRVQVTDSASLEPTSLTLVVLLQDMIGDMSGFSMFLSKEGVSGYVYAFMLYNSGSIGLYGASLSSLSTALLHKKCLAVSATRGSKPIFYTEGVYAGLGVVDYNTTATGAGGLSVGNGRIGLQPCLCSIKAALVISRICTATEHALLYNELESIKWDRNI